jgi:DNA-3-methyladenine glycosylase II
MGTAKSKSDEDRWAHAAKHLSDVDPVLGKVIKRVGLCTMTPRKDYFVMLCRAIYAQQVSTRVAEVLFQRFKALCPSGRVTPMAVIELIKVESNIKAAGLSRQKAIYLKDLAEHFIDNRIPIKKLAKMTDDEIIESLVAVNGVGRWTAEMFLMFVLNRPDVLPVDDLGLREGVRDVFNLPERPKPKEVIEMGERWRPYRSVATWYFWRRNTGKAPDAKSEEPISDRAEAAVKAAKKVTARPARAAARRAASASTRRRSATARAKS